MGTNGSDNGTVVIGVKEASTTRIIFQKETKKFQAPTLKLRKKRKDYGALQTVQQGTRGTKCLVDIGVLVVVIL